MNTMVLLRPEWLAALPLLALLAIWLWRRGPAAGGWERVMPPRMLAAMRSLGHLEGPGGRIGLAAMAAAGLLVVGLSGPALRRQDAPLLAESGSVLIAIDMSPSVAQGPALGDAQAAAAQIIASASGRPVGLLVYAGEAFEVAAPTADPATLQSQIAVLGPDTVPGRGTRPAAALALARQMLEDDRDADLVMISDGGGIDDAVRAEADRLDGAGVRLFALTLAGAAGGSPDPQALASLAQATAPARDPGPVLERLTGSGALGRDETLTALRFRDLGPLVAGLALLPLLTLFRRHA